MGCLLDIRNLALFTPRGLPLFRAEGFTLSAGDFLHIHGENGSGKSTVVLAFLGQYSHYTGEIGRFYSADEVAFLPQMGNTKHLLPLSLRDIVQQRRPVSERAMAEVGLLSPEDLGRAWNVSSGGERQKALLTQVFTSKAELIVLDEPFNHLDVAARGRVIELIAKARQQGSAVIVVSHDAPELAEAASHRLSTERTTVA